MAGADRALASPVAVAALLPAATARLRASGSPSPRLDAELLVAHALGRGRAWLHAHPEAPVADARVVGWLEAAFQRRASGEPVAYIRGFKEWRSLRVRTDRRALIPRPETELLADTAIAEIAGRLTSGDEQIACWEVGTGSGAVALALALRFRSALALGRLRLVASDLAPDALELASENLAERGVATLVTLVCGDLLDGAGAVRPLPDVVVANLPYLTSEEVARGEGSLRFEPQAALDGGPDGLVLIRHLLSQLPDRLAPGGVALLEIGSGQAASAARTAASLPGGFTTTIRRDLAGVERVLTVRRPAPAAA